MPAGATRRKLSVKKGGTMRMHPGIDFVDWLLLGMTLLALLWVLALVGYAAIAAALREPRHRPHWHRRPKHA
jgi:hypothetical protein